MCTPEKKASVWSTYLNAQYNALWRIATECGDRDEEKCRFYRALATFDYSVSGDTSGTEEGQLDRVTFHEPQLIFICNHAVVLTLTINEGQLTNLSGDDDGPLESINMNGMSASFRMSFTRTHVTGRDAKIDDQAADHEVRMVVFDFEKATLVTEHESAVETFFKTYLKYLRRAGHHVLFGFPDFTDKKILESLPVDYAILRRPEEILLDEFCRAITYFNITTTQINDYIQHVQYEGAEARAREKKEILAASIAKVRWSKEATVVFDIKFGVPIVQALCPHEVLYIFTVEEITQLDNVQILTQSYTAAFVVNVSEFDGKTLKVDFRTARFAETSSSLHEFESASSIVDWQSITEYLSTGYMDILTKFNYNILFGPPEERRQAVLKDGGFWRRVHNVTDFLAVRRYGESAIWIDRSQHVSMSGAYQAFALSERAIDDIVRNKWFGGGYDRWETEAFKATFKSFSIRLMSNDHLLVVVEIEEAEVISGNAQSKRPGRGPPLRIFQSRRGHTATELQARIEEEQRESYKGTMVFEMGIDFYDSESVNEEQAFTFEMILTRAEYIDSLSDLLEFKSELKASEGSQATVRRFIQQYFADLAEKKGLIIGTVLSRAGAQRFEFKSICEREVKVENFLTTRSEASDSSIIVICALHSEGAIPSYPWSPGWLPSSIQGGVGTAWISKEAFLERLLEVLEIFNAHTTIVRGSNDRFVTFDARNANVERGEKTRWQRESAGDLENEYMEYNWHYTYDANRREGTLLTQDLEALLLRTQNQVWIPTESSSKTHQVELAITGEHHTEAAKKQKYSHQLLKKDTTIWWELIVVISSSTEDGLSVTVNHESNVVVEGDDSVEDTVHAAELLNLDDIVVRLENNLREVLKGPWACNWFDLNPTEYECTNPVFTRSGDLVFEIYQQGGTDLGAGGLADNVVGEAVNATRLNDALTAMSGSQAAFTSRQTITRTTTTQSGITQQATGTRGTATPRR